MKKNNCKKISIFSTILFAGTACFAQVVTVNPSGSIQTAVNNATPGTIIQVTAGTYTQKVLFTAKNGTAGNLITLKADPGVILSGTGLTPSGREGLITIKNSNYIRVEGFDIQNFITAGGQTPVGILVETNASNIEIVNNKIHNIRNNKPCKDPCGEGAHGLGVFGTNTTGITDILVQGNEVYNNILESSEAVVINGNVDRFKLLNNNVHDNNNIGYDFIGYENECAGCGANDRVRNGLVRNNIATNNTSTANPWYSNSPSAGGFYVDGGQYIIFEGNRSTGNDLGFEFASEHGGKATEDIVMMNNFVYNNRDVGVALGGSGPTLGEARRIQIHNNSFYNNKGFGTEVTLQYKVINSQFTNNIFFGKGTAAQSYESIGTGSSGNTWGKNIWWGTSNASSGLPGTLLVQNPLYIAPASGDLKIQATSPAINAGAVTANLTTWTSTFWDGIFPPNGDIPVNGLTDFNGEARQEGIIDLGADEFGTGSGTGITIPSAPTALATTANSSSQITLTWTDNSNNETGFQVERSLTSGSGFAPVTTTAANAVTFANTGLAASTTYYYRIRSTNTAGTSAYSATASASTQAAPITIPTAPSALAVTANSSSQITLTWADNSNNETGFQIERSLTNGSGFTPVTTTAANAATFSNTGLAASTTYYYRIRSTNTAGSSAYTTVANATTQSAGGGITITVDGNTADWAAIAAISTTGSGGVTSLKACSDATYLYILVQGTTSTNYDLFINKDNNTATGIISTLWVPEGSDYVLENGVLNLYNGTGANWSWTTTGVTQTGISVIKTPTVIEARIPKASITGLGSTIKIGVDIESATWTNVGAIPVAGSPQATYVLGATARLQSAIPSAATVAADVEKNSVQIYPNPARDVIKIQYRSAKTKGSTEFSIYTAAGKKVKSYLVKSAAAGFQQKTISVNDLSSGTYFLKYTTGNKIVSKTFIIVR
jgi:hypothetical protein